MCEHCEHRSTCQNPCPAVAAALDAVTGQPNGREVLVSLDALEYLWTTNSRLSLANMQGAWVLPPLELVFGQLTERQKKILVLAFEIKLSVRQIAKQLGIHPSSVHESLGYARIRVRHYLANRQKSAVYPPTLYEG